MEIRMKDPFYIERRKNVMPASLNVHDHVVDGWIRHTLTSAVFYPSSEWEPVEEWVTIQVRKDEWDNVHAEEGEPVTVNWRYKPLTKEDS